MTWAGGVARPCHQLPVPTSWEPFCDGSGVAGTVGGGIDGGTDGSCVERGRHLRLLLRCEERQLALARPGHCGHRRRCCRCAGELGEVDHGALAVLGEGVEVLGPNGWGMCDMDLYVYVYI